MCVILDLFVTFVQLKLICFCIRESKLMGLIYAFKIKSSQVFVHVCIILNYVVTFCDLN